MGIYISTNLFLNHDFEEVFPLLDRLNDTSIGIEIFPMWHESDYERRLLKNIDKLQQRPITFHGPYYYAEYSASKGTAGYLRTMEMFRKTLEWAKVLKSGHIVHHHNNCEVAEYKKDEMRKASLENLHDLNSIAGRYGQRLIIENCGVPSCRNVLFNQEEFTQMCLGTGNDCLIDIGHAHCNGWNIAKLMEDLQNKITAYHIHNNYQEKDDHNRIYDGTLDMDGFFDNYMKLTPKADIVIEYCSHVKGDLDGVAEDVNRIKSIVERCSIAG